MAANQKEYKFPDAIHGDSYEVFIAIVLYNVPNEKERVKHLPINVKLK